MPDYGFFREVFQSLNKNKLRTLLSGFTVAFAIMLFTILFGIANGFQNTFENEFGGDANNSIFIYSGRTSKAVEGYQTGRKIQFDNKLYEKIKDEFSNEIEFISGRIYKNVTASYGTEHRFVGCRRTRSEYMQAQAVTADPNYQSADFMSVAQQESFCSALRGRRPLPR